MPPLPKPAHLRQRRNRDVTRATLPSVKQAAQNKVPPLYKREKSTERWHARVVAWWGAVWRSPMASEWLEADVLGLVYRTAELQQDFWTASDATGRIAVETRIDKNEERLGLSPIDRRRLQWEVEKGEQAEERIERRRRSKELDKATKGKDPRDIIKAVAS
jgi:hypothetical protein